HRSVVSLTASVLSRFPSTRVRVGKQKFAIVVLLWLGMGVDASLAADAAKGELAPEIKLDGKTPEGRCTFVASNKERRFESATGSALELPPGSYELRVECKDDDETLVPATSVVQVGAGKIASPKIDVRAARVRVEARRNGIMLAAKVRLVPAGT